MNPAIVCLLALLAAGTGGDPMSSNQDAVLLKAVYSQCAGTDPEYAQGAIERNEVAHREVVRFTWLIAVPAPGDPETWQRNLNAAVDPKHGSFRVTAATEEEKRKVASGEIVLQK